MHICRILAFPKEQKKWHTLDLVIFNLKKDSEYSLVLSNLLTEFPLGPIKGGKLWIKSQAIAAFGIFFSSPLPDFTDFKVFGSLEMWITFTCCFLHPLLPC